VKVDQLEFLACILAPKIAPDSVMGHAYVAAIMHAHVLSSVQYEQQTSTASSIENDPQLYASKKEVAEIRQDVADALRAVEQLLKSRDTAEGAPSVSLDLTAKVQLLQNTTDMLQEGLDSVAAVAAVCTTHCFCGRFCGQPYLSVVSCLRSL
jgi:hypothetical protein